MAHRILFLFVFFGQGQGPLYAPLEMSELGITSSLQLQHSTLDGLDNGDINDELSVTSLRFPYQAACNITYNAFSLLYVLGSAGSSLTTVALMQ